jgi:hypothetical protein
MYRAYMSKTVNFSQGNKNMFSEHLLCVSHYFELQVKHNLLSHLILSKVLGN